MLPNVLAKTAPVAMEVPGELGLKTKPATIAGNMAGPKRAMPMRTHNLITRKMSIDVSTLVAREI